MQFTSSGRWKLPGLAQYALDLTFRTFAYYLIPIAIGVVSIVALVCWDSQYVSGSSDGRDIRVVRETAPLSPAAANARLHAAIPVSYFDTHLSEAPVWFRFSTHPRAPGSIAADVIEFPSRHAVDIACWDATTLQPLGTATREEGTP
jgi:hypothetical protein